MIFLARFLIRHLKGYRLIILIVVIVTVLQVFVSLQAPIIIKFVADKLVSPHKDPTAPYITILNIFDHVSPGKQHSDASVIIFLVIMLILVGVIGAGLSYVQQYMASKIGQNLTANLRQQLFDQLQRLSLDWHGKQKKGDLIQRITGDIANIEKLIIDGLVDLMAGILTLILSIWIMLVTQVQLTLISIVILPALFFIILTYTRGIKAAAKRASKAAGEVADVASEDVGAITVLKAFSLEDREAIRFNKYVGKSRDAALEAGRLQAQFTPVVDILVSIGTAFIIAMGAFAISSGKFPIINAAATTAVTIGTLTLFIGYLKQLYQPMRDLSKLTNVATSAAAGAERIQEIFDQAPEITEKSTPYGGAQRLRGEITFQNVIFGYTPERPILKGINLHIPAGKKVALVGLSGGGKTTLVKLIPRFYEIQQGAVMIDGVDNRQYPLSLLRRNVSQVLQDSVLFEGTILENIKIGRPEATMEQIVSAAQQAQIHETILSMPDGYNTKVRERGKNFSGGQRQRLAIARAILCDSPILILDEPTASLDVEAEVEVLRAIDTLVVGRTVLMISHRLSTLGNVDEIIVLKDGLIVEQGSYQALKKSGGVFAGLLKEQNRYNVDYAGGSMIVPKAELQRVLSAQRQAQSMQQSIPASFAPAPQGRPGIAPTIIPSSANAGYGNGANQKYIKARVFVDVNGKVVGEYQLDKPTLTVGRLSDNDVPVPSQRVSRLHAKIHWDRDRNAWFIEDAESLNGLLYQGQRVDHQILNKGDRIYIAPSVAIVYDSL